MVRACVCPRSARMHTKYTTCRYVRTYVRLYCFTTHINCMSHTHTAETHTCAYVSWVGRAKAQGRRRLMRVYMGPCMYMCVCVCVCVMAQDRERGVVWEETIIFMPKGVRMVFLSATLANASDFAGTTVAHTHTHTHDTHAGKHKHRGTPHARH